MTIAAALPGSTCGHGAPLSVSEATCQHCSVLRLDSVDEAKQKKLGYRIIVNYGDNN